MADLSNSNDDIVFDNEHVVDEAIIIAHDELSDDQQGYLTQFAPDIDGASFNDKGAIVGSDGKVIISKADLDIKIAGNNDQNNDDTDEEKVAKLEQEVADAKDVNKQALKTITDNNGQPITIDGIEYTIKDGVAVDANGIIKLDQTALQTAIAESLTNDNDDDNYIEQLSGLTGFNPIDDKGESIAYENSIEGIAKYISDTVRQEGGRLYQEEQNAFFNANPQLKDAYNYLQVNQTLEGYGNVTNHSNVSLDKNNIEQLSSIIVEGEMLRGRTKEQALRMVGYAKDDNRLFDDATDNLAFIQGKESAEVANREAKVAAANEAAATAAATYWNGIKDTISGGTLEGYVIPENIQIRDDKGNVINKGRDDFYNYVSQTVDEEGNSAAALARAKRGAELELLIDYVMFTGGDLKSLVNLQVKKEQAKNAKLQFGKNSNKGSRIVIGKANNGKVDNNSIK